MPLQHTHTHKMLRRSKQPAGVWFICISIALLTFGCTTVLTTFGGYSVTVLGFDKNYAIALSVGSYLFLVNFTALLGGIVGQKFSHKKIVLLGGLYAALGLCLIANANLALMGLATYAVGTGMIIPNIYASLSRLYSSDDPRRNAGFTLLFVFVNIGVFLNSMLTDYILPYTGYSYMFIFSSFFAVIGTLIFIQFDQNIAKRPLMIQATDRLNLTNSDAYYSILGIMVLATAATRYLLDNLLLNMFVMVILCVLSIAYLIRLIYQNKHITRNRLIGLLVLSVVCIAFWFAERLSSIVFIEYSGLLFHNNIFGWNGAPEDIINIISTLVITLFAIAFAIYWSNKNKGQNFMILPILISAALVFTALAFISLWLGEQAGLYGHYMSASTFLLVAVFIMAIAKTILIPLYYGMAGKLAMREQESTLIGIMQLFIGFAGIITIALTHHSIPKEIIFASHKYNTISLVAGGLISTLLILAVLLLGISKIWRKHVLQQGK